MLGQFQITQYGAHLAPSELHTHGLWLHRGIPFGGLQSAIFPTETLLSFRVKHRENEMLDHLGCQLRSDLVDWDFIICLRALVLYWLCCAAHHRLWKSWQLIDITVFRLVSLAPQIRRDDKIVDSDMLLAHVVNSRKGSLSVLIFGTLWMHLDDPSLVLRRWDYALGFEDVFFLEWCEWSVSLGRLKSPIRVLYGGALFGVWDVVVWFQNRLRLLRVVDYLYLLVLVASSIFGEGSRVVGKGPLVLLSVDAARRCNLHEFDFLVSCVHGVRDSCRFNLTVKLGVWWAHWFHRWAALALGLLPPRMPLPDWSSLFCILVLGHLIDSDSCRILRNFLAIRERLPLRIVSLSVTVLLVHSLFHYLFKLLLFFITHFEE